MKISSIKLSTAIALLSGSAAADSAAFKPFDKSQLSTAAFFEQFDSADWAQLWKISKARRDNELTYRGEWAVEESIVHPGFKNDKGLVLKTPAAHHAIHAKLPAPFTNLDDTLVLQYEVKLQDSLSCGGAYIKLLSAEGLPDENTEFNNDSSYQVMFGPDKCGALNKVHLIIRRKSPITGEYEEKHLKVSPPSRVVKITSLYTLIIEPNQDFQIRINGDVVKSGNLLDAKVFAPGFNPPKEISDENDVKPEDWEDQEMILDPENLEKPADWDEDAPQWIPDPKQTEKPTSWDEDAPEYIDDPEAERPEDWDDEEDGEWVAPLIPNPECETHGCGKWVPDLVPNPDFKGKWTPPYVKNPKYIGEWAPRLIPNPNYYEDTRPSDLEAIGGIGFELWSIENNILFDNIYLGHSIEEAELVGNETYVPKIELEQQAVLESNSKVEAEEEAEESRKIEDASEKSDLLEILAIKGFAADGQRYAEDFLADPLTTLNERPLEGGIYASVLVAFTSFLLTLFSFILNIFSGSSRSREPVTKTKTETEKVAETKDDAKASTTSSETKFTKSQVVNKKDD